MFVCVLVFCSMNGVLEFYDTADVVCMNQAEHFMATDVEWDPTGRYVATSVSWWAHKVEFRLSINSSKAKQLPTTPSSRSCFRLVAGQLI